MEVVLTNIDIPISGIPDGIRDNPSGSAGFSDLLAEQTDITVDSAKKTLDFEQQSGEDGAIQNSPFGAVDASIVAIDGNNLLLDSPTVDGESERVPDPDPSLQTPNSRRIDLDSGLPELAISMTNNVVDGQKLPPPGSDLPLDAARPTDSFDSDPLLSARSPRLASASLVPKSNGIGDSEPMIKADVDPVTTFDPILSDPVSDESLKRVALPGQDPTQKAQAELNSGRVSQQDRTPSSPTTSSSAVSATVMANSMKETRPVLEEAKEDVKPILADAKENARPIPLQAVIEKKIEGMPKLAAAHDADPNPGIFLQRVDRSPPQGNSGEHLPIDRPLPPAAERPLSAERPFTADDLLASLANNQPQPHASKLVDASRPLNTPFESSIPLAQIVVAPSATAPMTIASPPSVVDGTLPMLPSMSLPVNGNDIDWSNGLGDRVRWMIGQKHNAATIRLDPPSLGKLTVQIHLGEQLTSVTIHAQHAQTRDLIDSASFRLRDFLQDSGYQNVNVDVSHRQDQHQQGGAQASFASAAEATEDMGNHRGIGEGSSHLAGRSGSTGLIDTFA